MVSVSTLQLSFREVSCVGFCVLTLSDGNIHNYFGNTTRMFFPFSAVYQGKLFHVHQQNILQQIESNSDRRIQLPFSQITLNISNEAREVVKWLTKLTSLAEDWVRLPAPTSGDLQLPLNLMLGDPVPFASAGTCTHACLLCT